MASAIDDTKPTSGTALTSDVRANFTTAKNEITALQSLAGATGIEDNADSVTIRITADENVAIGTEAMHGSLDATGTWIQLGHAAFAYAAASAAQGNWYDLLENAYYDNVGYKYVVDGAASGIELANGRLLFFVAGAGTAGDAISFTDVLDISSAGTVTGSIIKTENSMVSNSPIHLASQASIKAYVDAGASTTGITDNTTGPVLILSDSNVTVNQDFKVQGASVDIEINNLSATATRLTLKNTSNEWIFSKADNGSYSMYNSAAAVFVLSFNNTGGLLISACSVIHDEDDMVSASDEHLASQQSIKAYVDKTSTTAALEAVANAINTSAAKVAGFTVYNTTTGTLVTADGSADASVWKAAGSTVHTPVS